MEFMRHFLGSGNPLESSSICFNDEAIIEAYGENLIDTEMDDIMSWSKKHPEEWSSGDVINWIYSVAVRMNMNLEKLRGEEFQNMTGRQLCSLSMEDFLCRDQNNGAQLYRCLQENLMLRQNQFVSPSAELSDIDDCFDDICGLYAESQIFDFDNLDLPISSQPIPGFAVFLKALEPMNKHPFDDIRSPEDGCGGPIPTCVSSYCVDSDVKNGPQDSGYESGENSSTENSFQSTTMTKMMMSSSPVSKLNLFSPSTEEQHQFTLDDTPSFPGSGDHVATSTPAADVTSTDATGSIYKRKPGRPPKRTLSSSSASSLCSSSSSASASFSADEYSSSKPKKSKKKKVPTATLR